MLQIYKLVTGLDSYLWLVKFNGTKESKFLKDIFFFCNHFGKFSLFNKYVECSSQKGQKKISNHAHYLVLAQVLLTRVCCLLKKNKKISYEFDSHIK